ncbi:MAG: glycosyltransferase family 9 protein [Ignavibacteria bacterium]|nr:glycosyltransferase family 9 protein [Ignavibacteria bacterium]
MRNHIRSFAPDVLVYILEQRHTRRVVLRDMAFFRACGISRIIGAPWRRDLFEHRWLPARQRFENQAERLARCLAPLGDARLSDPASWDLKLTTAERDRASLLLEAIPAAAPVIACCPGTKIEVKDWGEEHWTRVLSDLATLYSNHAIAFIGSADERERCERLRTAWTGPSVNLCGRTTPREAAAVIARCIAYLGHDTGPMHLAAAAGVPCVAVFSARNKPGEWYPYGDGHRVLYHKVPCLDCRLEVCTEHGKMCILSITPDEVVAAFRDAIPVSA